MNRATGGGAASCFRRAAIPAVYCASGLSVSTVSDSPIA